MDDLKKLSVERLRELARKHLGKGHSRLRTRAQLLAALKDVLRQPLSRLLDVLPSGKTVRVVDFPPGRRGKVRAAAATPSASPAPTASPTTAVVRTAAATPSASSAPAAPPTTAPAGRGASSGKATGSPVEREGVRPSPPRAARPGASSGRNGPARRPSGRNASPVSPEAMASAPLVTSAPATPLAEPVPLPPEPPVAEAFFEVPALPRRVRRAPAPAPPLDLEPFASPREVGTEAPLLLVRDPTTLFVFWDFRRELERGAALGLREPRLLLRLYRAEDLDRSLELPLIARSVYVTGLASGQEYTAEVLLLGRDGWTRPVGARSAARRLPPGRVSSQLEVRTLRLPWSEPLSTLPPPAASTVARQEPLDSPRRVPLPTSPGAHGAAGGPAPSSGPRSGRN
jgi:hypothetical protein